MGLLPQPRWSNLSRSAQVSQAPFGLATQERLLQDMRRKKKNWLRFLIVYMLCCPTTLVSAKELSYELESEEVNSLIRATVYLGIRYVDRYGMTVYSEHGHGVYITDDGAILTAAHVLLGNPAYLANDKVTGYEVSVFSSDPKSGELNYAGVLLSNEVIENSIYSVSLGKLITKCSAEFKQLPCVKDLDDRTDYIVFKLPNSDEADKFSHLDIVGPGFGVKGKFNSIKMAVIVSTFDGKKLGISRVLKGFMDKDTWQLQNDYILPGVSGSPIVGLFDDQTMAVVGLVRSMENGTAKTAQFTPIFTQLLLGGGQENEESLSSKSLLETDKHKKLFYRKEKLHKCERGQKVRIPDTDSLLNEYFYIVSNSEKIPKSEITDAYNCYENIKAWEPYSVMLMVKYDLSNYVVAAGRIEFPSNVDTPPNNGVVTCEAPRVFPPLSPLIHCRNQGGLAMTAQNILVTYLQRIRGANMTVDNVAQYIELTNSISGKKNGVNIVWSDVDTNIPKTGIVEAVSKISASPEANVVWEANVSKPLQEEIEAAAKIKATIESSEGISTYTWNPSIYLENMRTQQGNM